MRTDKCKCGANNSMSCKHCSMLKLWGYVNGDRVCWYSAFSTEVTYKHPERIADQVEVRLRKKYGSNPVFFAEMNTKNRNENPFKEYK